MLNLDKSTWTTHRFGSMVRNVNESVKDAGSAGIDKVIALDHLDPGEITISRYGAVADGTTFTRRVRPGQTLFGKRRAYQRKAAYAEVDAICSGDILVFAANPEALSPRLLPFIVHSEAFYNHALGTSAGSLSPRTSWKALAEFEIALPLSDEQERLADLLWAIETHRQTTSRTARSAEAAARTARARAMHQPLARTVLAQEAFEFSTGVRRTPDRAAGEYMTPYLRSANVGAGVLDLHDVQHMNYLPAERERFALRAGDVLVTEGSASATAVGMPARWADELPAPVCFQMTLIRLRSRPELCTPDFLYQWAMWAWESGAFLDVAGGTNIKHISAERSKTMPINLPPLPQQHQLTEELESFGKLVARLQGEVAELTLLRKSILSGLFGGTE